MCRGALLLPRAFRLASSKTVRNVFFLTNQMRCRFLGVRHFGSTPPIILMSLWSTQQTPRNNSSSVLELRKMRRAAGNGSPNPLGSSGYGVVNRGVGTPEAGGVGSVDPEMGSTGIGASSQKKASAMDWFSSTFVYLSISEWEVCNNIAMINFSQWCFPRLACRWGPVRLYPVFFLLDTSWSLYIPPSNVPRSHP